MDGSPVDKDDPKTPISPVPRELYDSGSDMEPMEAEFVAVYDDVIQSDVKSKAEAYLEFNIDENDQWERPLKSDFELSSPEEEPEYTRTEPPAHAKSFPVMGEGQLSSPSKKAKFRFPSKFSINMISLTSPARNIRAALMACLVLSTFFVFYLFVRRRSPPEGVVQLTFDHNYPGDGIVNRIWDMSNPEVAAAAKAQQEYEAEKALITEPAIEEAPMDQGFPQWGNDQQQQQQGLWGQPPEQATQQPSAFNFQGGQFGAQWGQDQQQQQQQQQQPPQQPGLPGMAQFGQQQPQQQQQPSMGQAGGMFGQGQQQKPFGADAGMGQFGARSPFGQMHQPQQQQQQQQQQQFGGYQAGVGAQGARPGGAAGGFAHLSPAERAAAAVGGFAAAGNRAGGFGAARQGQAAGGFGAGAQAQQAGGFGAGAAAGGSQGYQRPAAAAPGGFGAQAAGGYGARAGGQVASYRAQAQMVGRGVYAQQQGQQVGQIVPAQSHNMPADNPVQNFAF